MSDSIDNLAQSILFGLVFCSVLSDTYFFTSDILKNKNFKKNIEYVSDVFNAVTSYSLNNYKNSDDGSIIIENKDISKNENENKNISINENKDISKKDIENINITITENKDISKNENENMNINTNKLDEKKEESLLKKINSGLNLKQLFQQNNNTEIIDPKEKHKRNDTIEINNYISNDDNLSENISEKKIKKNKTISSDEYDEKKRKKEKDKDKYRSEEKISSSKLK